jgi:hypothetical protein
MKKESFSGFLVSNQVSKFGILNSLFGRNCGFDHFGKLFSKLSASGYNCVWWKGGMLR